MLEFAKKGLYLGLGLATLTKDKIQSFAKEVAEKTRMTEEEGKKFAEFLDEESQKARESLRQNIQQIVDATIGQLPWKKKIAELEARVQALEKAMGIEPAVAEETAETETVEAEQTEPAEAQDEKQDETAKDDA